MHCTNCGKEWKAPARFCMVCGHALGGRSEEAIREELNHVEWLLGEITSWDDARVRRQLRAQYEARRAALLVELSPVSQAERKPTVLEIASTSQPDGDGLVAALVNHEDARAPEVNAVSSSEGRESEAETNPAPAIRTQSNHKSSPPRSRPQPHEGAARARREEPLFFEPLATADDRVVAAASAWSRVWKPFLSESVGWFIGGFLILAGTLYWVNDAWLSMTPNVQALTVFGLAGGWALAFVTWARFLLRREHTHGAGVVLERIAAVIAPLATVAIGPLRDSPVLFWPLVTAWSALSGWLALTAVKRTIDPTAALRSSWPVGAAMSLATLMLGAGPAIISVTGSSGMWLSLIPIALTGLTWSAGPRSSPRATWFVFTAMSYATALFVIRIDLALRAAGQGVSIATYAPLIAAMASCALWLRPKATRAADLWSIGVVSAQSVLLVPALMSAAPGFVIAALAASWTTARLALERVSKASARWVVPAYIFGYLAFQRIDQVVPPVVIAWWAALKASLGYETAPMPASYVSIYAAIFVVIAGLFAAWRFTSKAAKGAPHQRAEADMLLYCTAVASIVFGGMASLSIFNDARPALIALPILTALCIGLGFWLDRAELTAAGALLAVASGLSYDLHFQAAMPEALTALALAPFAVIATRKHRTPVSIAALALAAFVVLSSFARGPWSASDSVALLIASFAALAVARNLDDRIVLACAWSVPFFFVAHASNLLAVNTAPLLLAGAALAGAIASRSKSRLETLWVPSSVAALAAAVWGVQAASGAVLDGFSLVVASAALLAAAIVERRRLLTSPFEALGLIIGAMALLPAAIHLEELGRAFGWMTPQISLAVCAIIGAAASVRAIKAGREWQTVLIGALIAVLSTVDFALSQTSPFASVTYAAAGAVILLTTPALLASITVPLVSLLWAFALQHSSLGLLALASGLTLCSLFEEFDFTRAYLLNRSRIAWAASLSAALVLIGVTLSLSPVHPAMLASSLLLPMVWVRATRSTVPSAISLVLTLASVSQLDHALLFGPPLAAVILSRATDFDFVRRLLGRERATLGLPFFCAAIVSAVATAGIAEANHFGPALPIAWAVALMLMRDENLSIRLVFAALVLLAAPVAWAPAALILSALAFALHHGFSAILRVFGAQKSGRSAFASVAAALLLASVNLIWSGSPIAHGVFAATVLTAALIFNWLPLVSLAVASLGFNVHGIARGTFYSVTPFALEAVSMSALLAAAMRAPVIAKPIGVAWQKLSRRSERNPASPIWAGAFFVCLASLTAPSPAWLLAVALLALTPEPAEAWLALGLGAGMVFTSLPLTDAGLVFAIAGAGLAWSSALLERRWPVLRVWHHAGWLLAVVALGCCTDAHSSHFGAVWVLLAISLWAVAKRNRSLEAVAFGGTLISAHAVLAHLGIAFSTGAPPESILPWFALASTLVAVWPLARTTTLARKIFAYFAVTLAVVELCAGLVLLDGAHLPEALAGVVAMALASALLIRRALKDDSTGAALLAQTAAITGLVVLHHLALGAPLGPAETWIFLVSGLLLSEMQLSGRAPSKVSIALGIGAIAWPAWGALALLGQAPSFTALALMLIAAHFAIRARSTLHRGAAAVASVAAFNAAMFFGYNATAWLGPEYLAIPFGLSLLTLVWVFRGSLEPVTAARLRAVAVAVIYAAASVKPLTFEATWALWVCVLICVLGVAAGIILRIRSFVFLGTAFMVTSVVANLIHYGIREPRAGAIFLSGLGLLVVAFMVLVTTKRSELLARYKSVQAMLERWD